MKQKGFTLIELLAVIVVLAIIALIAVPIITNVIERAKKGSAEAGALGYIDAVEKYTLKEMIKGDKQLSTNSKVKISALNEVNVKGSKPTQGTVFFDNKGKISSAKLCVDNYSIEYKNDRANILNENKYCVEQNSSIEGDSITTLAINDFLNELEAADGLVNNQVYNLKTKNEEEIQIEYYEVEGNTTYDASPTLCNDTVDTYMCIYKYTGDLTINADVVVTPQVRKKGFVMYVDGTLTNNGTISMTARGAKAEGQDVQLFKNKDGSYEYVPATGGAGGARASRVSSGGTAGNAGAAGTNRRTGGGGSGSVVIFNGQPTVYSGAGAAGTSYSGGTGGSSGNKWGSSANRYLSGNPGEANGGAGGTQSNCAAGAGNPSGGTGGLLVIFSDTIVNNGIINSLGSSGATNTSNSYGRSSGGSSGGGSVNIFYKQGYTGTGTTSANGGTVASGGSGGAGTVTIGSIATGTFVAG